MEQAMSINGTRNNTITNNFFPENPSAGKLYIVDCTLYFWKAWLGYYGNSQRSYSQDVGLNR